MARSDLVALNRKVSESAPGALLPDACAVKTCLREVRIATLQWLPGLGGLLRTGGRSGSDVDITGERWLPDDAPAG